MTQYVNRKWILDVELGRVNSWKGVSLTGATFSMATDWMTIWDEADEIVDLSLQTTPATVKISSTDANDTLLGTGLRTLTLIGLDASGDEQEEVIELNGLTEVASSSTWSAINKMVALTAGSLAHNAGVVWAGNGTVTSGVPDTKFMLMDAELNISHTMIYTVPNGKRAISIAANVSSNDVAKGFTIRICVVEPGGLPIYLNIRGVAGGNNLDLTPLFSPPLSAGTVFTVQAKAMQGSGGNLAVLAEFLVEDL